MICTVHMLAWRDGDLRVVDIPDDEAKGKDTEDLLELVFYYGQNDFQSRPLPSVSVGDVAELQGKFYICKPMGWMEITPEQYADFCKMPQAERRWSELIRQGDDVFLL